MKRHDINGAASVRVVGWVVWILLGGRCFLADGMKISFGEFGIAIFGLEYACCARRETDPTDARCPK